MKDFKEELKVLFDVTKEISDKVLAIYEGQIDVEIKSDDSPLTQADKLSSSILQERLKPFGYGIVDEEKEDYNINQDYVWVLDPLDGTKDFVEKTDEFSIMVGLLYKGKPVLGFIFVPPLNLAFYAVKGEGAYRIKEGVKERIYVSDVSDLKDLRMVISRHHFTDRDKKFADSLGITRFKKMGSVGVKFCEIARGEAELCAYTTSKISVWDCVPAHIILKEAGGIVMDMTGKEPFYGLETKKMLNGFLGVNKVNEKFVRKFLLKNKTL